MSTTPYTIRSTTDYGMFQRITGNRTVRPSHVKKIKEAIAAKPDTIKYNPILVNERLEIIDGQHRAEALEQLEMPVWYVVVEGLTLTDVQKLNSIAKQWQPIDYAKAFEELGNQNYAYYVQVKQDPRLALNHDSLVKYLGLDEPNTWVSFNMGFFKVPDFDQSLDLLMKIHEVGPLYDPKRYKTRPFALAFLRIARDERYDHDRMVESMTNYGNLLEDRANELGYFKELNRIYNWRRNDRNKVFFGTPEYLSGK